MILATLNSAGYRYAAGDQAFYIPAVLRHLDPALFPRDAALIDAQAHIITVDDIVAAGVRLTGASLPHVFLALYLATLLALYAGIVGLGARFYRTRAAVIALAAALTLRHAIAKTGANTLESYFHPRELAFALGLFAVGAFLDRRWIAIAALLTAAAFLHPTTAMWFAVWLAAAGWAGGGRHRVTIAVAVIGMAAVASLLLVVGPLSGRLVRMDAEWLAAIGVKDLFPRDWPLNVWVTNLIALPAIAFVWRARRAAGVLVPGETALAIGACGVFVLFLCWLPFNVAHVAIAVQLQLSRVFWLLDVFATVYLIWWLSEGAWGPWGASGARGARGAQGAQGAWGSEARSAKAADRRAGVVACVVIAVSLARGGYARFVQFPDRALFAADVQNADWRDAMAFARSTDPSSGWLADPMHAAKYGSSLRATGQRDVLIEPIKDHAVAIYDRSIAMRVAERERALSVLAWDTPDGARALARRYGLDYLVIDRRLDLPLVHQSGSLFIYTLR